ncbi:TetR-like C-terminal domain-containing protein, partial [Mycobacterium sp.]|uniref:TetR-like C-terminal domain-containing protein n=1 Tax=Mycobacterium sp. TaxID=1785 RepID=UPI002D8A8ACE|nr:TetR-like C-terminal domain-containing protein [Mycobacterium sp.]
KTPELYRIATMGEGRPDSDVDMTLNTSAFVHLRNAVESLMAEGTYPVGDPTAYALELWTAAHGVAALLMSRPYLPWGDAEEFADRVLRAVCIGHIVAGMIGPKSSPQETVARLKGLADEQQDRR